MKPSLLVLAVCVSLSACRTEPAAPSARGVCEKLASVGVAAKCHPVKAAGLAAGAREVIAFEIPGMKAGGGQVMHFEKAADLKQASDQLESLAGFLGPHRYASAKARILVQLNPETPAELGSKVKDIVRAL